MRARRCWRLNVGERPSCAWRSGEGSVDFDHLQPFLATASLPESFAVDHAALTFLAERNAFNLGPADKLVVIGLRACALAEGGSMTGWGTSHALRLATPDHVTPNCVIGLWNRPSRSVRLFRAFTVPEAANIYASLAIGTGTSLLPTGLYDFAVGTHKATKPTRQPGALRNVSRYVVLRTGVGMTYNPADAIDAWTLGLAHNIHAAGRGINHPKFDSAGCQVIPGFYDPTRTKAEGPWAEFRTSAGIVRDDGVTVNTSANGNGRFKYMLLTGAEVALAAPGRADVASGYRRLRPGSSGPRVTAAQTALYRDVPDVFKKAGGVPSSAFDAKTAFFALADQKLNGPRKKFNASIVVG